MRMTLLQFFDVRPIITFLKKIIHLLTVNLDLDKLVLNISWLLRNSFDILHIRTKQWVFQDLR